MSLSRFGRHSSYGVLRLASQVAFLLFAFDAATGSDARPFRSAGLESTLRAQAVLNAAVHAMGGAETLTQIRTVRREYVNNIGPTDRATQILVAYFPKERLLFEADLFDPVSRELSIASVDGASLAAKIRSLGLQVDRIVPVHGIMSSHSALQQGVAIRAKYVK